MEKQYRKLRNTEILIMESLGCSCKDWEKVEVAEDFIANRVRESSFSGFIKLGSFKRTFFLSGGIQKKSGIRNVALHNVEIEDDCYVENVHNYIANYKIGSNSFIENVDLILVDGISSFGNGVPVNVLNETGGREILIHNKLSAQIAYITALYRHRPKLIEKINELSRNYAQKHSSAIGTIGSFCTIINTGKVSGVKIGDYCNKEGASFLMNGTINSTKESPVSIGVRVRAKDFIISSGAKLDSGCCIERCYVGQSTVLANGYMAQDSVFFANCHGENGEACSVFAGPFTVTHHKSSLLISGLFSFMNTGSGSNQSNHMYKLGPIHQGLMERGSKTTSDSYILWPAHIGAFSLVMGRHVFHPDTSNLPFSYLIEKKNATYLSPGVNLRSVGTIRDAQKWPKRDKRAQEARLDNINYNLLSPYTIQKMFNGIQILEDLKKTSGETTDVFTYHSAKITNSSLSKGLDYYHIAIKKFLGNSIIKRLETFNPYLGDKSNTSILPEDKQMEQIRELLSPSTLCGKGDWLDLSGLIAPKNEIENLLNDIEENKIHKLGEINEVLNNIHANYYNYEWTWASEKLETYFNISLKAITKDQIIEIVKEWKQVLILLDKMVYDDAKKEFSLAVKTSFGADGSLSDKAKDFAQVRGEFESNPFVMSVLDHIKVKGALGDELISRLIVY